MGRILSRGPTGVEHGDSGEFSLRAPRDGKNHKLIAAIELGRLPAAEHICYVRLGTLVVGSPHVEGFVGYLAECGPPGFELGEALKSGCIRSFSDRRKQRVVGHGRDAVPFGVGQVGNDAQAFLVKGGIGFNQGPGKAHRPREVRPHKALWGWLRDVSSRTLARQSCQSTQNEKSTQKPEHD